MTWERAADVPEVRELVGAVLATSVDAWDIAAVETFGPDGAADRILSPRDGFSHRPAWWQVIRYDRTPAGFVLPVIFDDCARDGLDEATIYHMGVAPAHRGRKLARLLLRKATLTLLDHGVWRIYCDTAAANGAMIHVFESEGWRRLPATERPIAVG